MVVTVCLFPCVLQAANPLEALLDRALQEPYLWAPVLSMLLHRWGAVLQHCRPDMRHVVALELGDAFQVIGST